MHRQTITTTRQKTQQIGRSTKQSISEPEHNSKGSSGQITRRSGTHNIEHIVHIRGRSLTPIEYISEP